MSRISPKKSQPKEIKLDNVSKLDYKKESRLILIDVNTLLIARETDISPGVRGIQVGINESILMLLGREDAKLLDIHFVIMISEEEHTTKVVRKTLANTHITAPLHDVMKQCTKLSLKVVTINCFPLLPNIADFCELYNKTYGNSISPRQTLVMSSDVNCLKDAVQEGYQVLPAAANGDIDKIDLDRREQACIAIKEKGEKAHVFVDLDGTALDTLSHYIEKSRLLDLKRKIKPTDGSVYIHKSICNELRSLQTQLGPQGTFQFLTARSPCNEWIEGFVSTLKGRPEVDSVAEAIVSTVRDKKMSNCARIEKLGTLFDYHLCTFKKSPFWNIYNKYRIDIKTFSEYAVAHAYKQNGIEIQLLENSFTNNMSRKVDVILAFLKKTPLQDRPRLVIFYDDNIDEIKPANDPAIQQRFNELGVTFLPIQVYSDGILFQSSIQLFAQWAKPTLSPDSSSQMSEMKSVTLFKAKQKDDRTDCSMSDSERKAIILKATKRILQQSDSEGELPKRSKSGFVFSGPAMPKSKPDPIESGKHEDNEKECFISLDEGNNEEEFSDIDDPHNDEDWDAPALPLKRSR